MKGPTLKTCAKCTASLPIDCFYKNKAEHTGRDYYCKTCRNAATTAWVDADPIRKLRHNASSRASYARRKKRAA